MIVAVLAAASATLARAGAPDDRAALQGVAIGKAVFDVNLADAEKLPLYLGVIQETVAGLKAQGVRPEVIVAFRGPSVRLVSQAREAFAPPQREALAQADALLRDLAAQGVVFEACAVATRLFGVDNGSFGPEVRVVGNTFASLIGYQAKGYGVIAIQ